MKIARLTSPHPDVLRQSLPRPRLRHGRRLALLFHPNLTLNLCTFFFTVTCSRSSSSSSPDFPNCSSSRKSASLYAAYLRSHFSVSQPKAYVAESEAPFLSSAESRAMRNLTRLCALISLLLSFLRPPPTFPPQLPLARTKLLIPC